MNKKKIQYFNSFDEDLVTSKNQNYQIDYNYKWNNLSPFQKIFSKIIYIPFLIFGLFYSKFILRVTFKNKKILKGYKNYFLYGNHTQALGDAFNPYVLLFPRIPYIIVSPSNLGIPIIGKLLPYLGALPIPNSIHQKEEFFSSIRKISENNIIIIYPEAHLWPWCTLVRPFSSTSFAFPVEKNIPSFSMTTTYQKSKFFKKPKITIYIDGPFYAKPGSKKEMRKDLCEQIYDSISKNSKHSNYEYINYIKKEP